MLLQKSESYITVAVNFIKPQSKGAMCLFTLKNHSSPEYVITTETGVVCLDIHPKYTYLICIGKYDGNVAVYDAHASGKEPQYESNSVTNKHSGIVWQVRVCSLIILIIINN